MKIIKQLSEDEFVIKMEEHDLKSYSTMRVAHDYVEFGDNMGIEAENGVKLYGKFASCANWIRALHNVHISIRTLIKVVLPYLNKHKYCQEEHLLTDDGKPNYIWSTDPLFYYTEEGQQVISFQDENGEYTTIPFSVYNQIKRRLKMELQNK
jgi:hypothetical protein